MAGVDENKVDSEGVGIFNSDKLSVRWMLLFKSILALPVSFFIPAAAVVISKLNDVVVVVLVVVVPVVAVVVIDPFDSAPL